jgi:urocanate hydratase
LALDPIESPALDFILQVERHYANLIAAGSADFDPKSESTLGGKLLYAGELNAAGRALLVAANIAGAASLAATADQAAQKQAVRDGVADFLVTSLSEALRILKNQIRKRETVAVCIASAPEAVEREMLERGVLPDLLRPADELSEHSPFVSQGARHIPRPTLPNDQTLLTWRVSAAPALWLPKLDAIALDCLPREDWTARRWLRLSPRYLGRLAQGVRVLYCEPEAAKEFIARAQLAVKRGEIGVQVWVSYCHNNETFVAQSKPPVAP